MGTIDIKQWMADRSEQDKRLYQLHGKPLESEHWGDFVAIGNDGRTILSTDQDEVLRQAIDSFGSGNFALTRVGEKTYGRWGHTIRQEHLAYTRYALTSSDSIQG